MIGEPTPARCHLQDAVGRVEACPERRCPFWEHGRERGHEGCGIELLELDLRQNTPLAQHLLELRLQLDSCRCDGADIEGRSLFYRL